MDKATGLARRDLGHVAADAGAIPVGIDCPVGRACFVFERTGVKEEGAFFTLNNRTTCKVVDTWSRWFVEIIHARVSDGLTRGTT